MFTGHNWLCSLNSSQALKERCANLSPIASNRHRDFADRLCILSVRRRCISPSPQRLSSKPCHPTPTRTFHHFERSPESIHPHRLRPELRHTSSSSVSVWPKIPLRPLRRTQYKFYNLPSKLSIVLDDTASLSTIDVSNDLPPDLKISVPSLQSSTRTTVVLTDDLAPDPSLVPSTQPSATTVVLSDELAPD